jgi:DNA-binding response OmpR family regulator
MKTILFVEDESVLQKTVRETLEQENYKVISALDGEAGLRLANPLDEKDKPDLILLDLILPKINGFDVLKKLKENQATKDIPVIVLTNLEGMKDIEKTIEAGATTYLVKANYSLKEVLEKVKNVLG